MADSEVDKAGLVISKRLARYGEVDPVNGTAIRERIAPQPVNISPVERDLTPEEMAKAERVRPYVENGIDPTVEDRLLVEVADRQKARNRR